MKTNRPRSHRGVLALSVGLVWSLVSVGCGSDETSPGSGGSGPSSTAAETTGAGGAQPATFGVSPCGICVHASCQAAFDACFADPECPAYAACLDACPISETGNADSACDAACPRGTGSESKHAIAAINACRDPGVGSECEACNVGERPETPPFDELNQTCTEPSDDDDECYICQDESCCETQDECSASPECVALRDCIRDPSTDIEECVLAHREVADIMARGIACLFYRCGDPCGPLPACLECMQDECGLEWAAHVRTGDGFLLDQCIGKCPVGDDVCDQACYDAYPGALDTYAALGECMIVTGCASGACTEE